MKANEAPEKIILSADRETGTLYDEWIIRDLTDNIKIEYTRTDAFIEKAIKYIANHFLAPGMNDEIKEFVKYMKGE